MLTNPTPTAPPSLQALPPGTALTLRLIQVTPPASPAIAPPPPQTAPPTAPQAAQAYTATQSVTQAPPPNPLAQPVPSLSQPAPTAPPAEPPGSAPPPPPQPSATPVTPTAPSPQVTLPSQVAPAAPEIAASPPSPTATPAEITVPPPVSIVEPPPSSTAVSQPAALEIQPAPQASSAPAPAAPLPLDSSPTPAPAISPSTAAPLADGDLLSGTVPASSRPASPLVDTPAGLLSLQAVVDLPPGSQVDLRLVGDPTPPPAVAPETAPPPVFPDLQRALEQIHLAEPQWAEQISRHLPRLGHPRLAFQLLALTEAARKGSSEPLSEEAELIAAPGKARPHGLLAALEEALSSLASPATLPGSGQDQWQSYVLPLFLGDRLEQMRLVVRDPPQGKEEAAARDEQGTRFLMDLDMTNLGPVQLDGLVKGRAKRFDLIIRTHDILSEPLRLGITEVFIRTLDSFAMTGKTSFQQTAKFIEAFPSTAGVGKNC